VIASGAARFVGFVGLGLVLQDLQDSATVGFGGDEYFRQDQGACWSGGLLALVLLDSPRLCSGRGGAQGRGRWVGVVVMTPSGVGRVRW